MKELKCPECGKTFNDTEQACPNCGCPANECSVVEPIKQKNEKTDSSEKKTKSRYAKGGLLPGETVIAMAEWQAAPIILIVVLFIIIIH